MKNFVRILLAIIILASFTIYGFVFAYSEDHHTMYPGEFDRVQHNGYAVSEAFPSFSAVTMYISCGHMHTAVEMQFSGMPFHSTAEMKIIENSQPVADWNWANDLEPQRSELRNLVPGIIKEMSGVDFAELHRTRPAAKTYYGAYPYFIDALHDLHENTRYLDNRPVLVDSVDFRFTNMVAYLEG